MDERLENSFEMATDYSIGTALMLFGLSMEVFINFIFQYNRSGAHTDADLLYLVMVSAFTIVSSVLSIFTIFNDFAYKVFGGTRLGKTGSSLRLSMLFSCFTLVVVMMGAYQTKNTAPILLISLTFLLCYVHVRQTAKRVRYAERMLYNLTSLKQEALNYDAYEVASLTNKHWNDVVNDLSKIFYLYKKGRIEEALAFILFNVKVESGLSYFLDLVNAKDNNCFISERDGQINFEALLESGSVSVDVNSVYGRKLLVDMAAVVKMHQIDIDR
ncbi:hypothetical protein C9J27_03065 [Photobacterium kishitanii]|uniref:Uncharacterized protein n=2 Tax=Photobacterium kishitanii TaxID=318456 RepID=A0A2T3KMJ4_9GAMM|nr:hypothetical protein C9J27_03065 [Photobacterium kishitanii]